MGQSTKAVLWLIFIVSSLVALVSWTSDNPDLPMWPIRLVSALLGVLSFAAAMMLQLRRDLAPDYLRQRVGNYFNRDGFTFAFATERVEQVGYLVVYSQNQYEGSSIGRIVLKPMQGFFTKAAIEAITFEIKCESGAFGYVRFPLPIPLKLQGNKQLFEVCASVHYPSGKGRRLRFQDGIFLRTNNDFGNAFGTALTIAGAATGSLILVNPANVTIDFPLGVAATIPESLRPESVTLWKKGQADLKVVN